MQQNHIGTLDVLSKSEAATSGLFRFYTGRMCKEGHIAERYVSNGQCITCNNTKARLRELQRGRQEPSFRMFRNTLRRTGMALRGFASPREAVGCDHPALRDYIAGQFRTGMSWGKYRQWEVDHITPLGHAADLDELIDRCHYTNLQPLWRSENRQKGGA